MDLHFVIPQLEGHEVDNDQLDKCKKAVLSQWGDGLNINLTEIKGQDYPTIFNKGIENVSTGYIAFLYPWVILKHNIVGLFEKLQQENRLSDIISFSSDRISFSIQTELHINGDISSIYDFTMAMNNEPGNVLYPSLWNKFLKVDLIKKNDIRFDNKFCENFEQAFLLDCLNVASGIECVDVPMCVFYTQPRLSISQEQRIYEKKSIIEKYDILLTTSHVDSRVDILNRQRLGYVVYERVNAEKSNNKLLKDIQSEIKGNKAKISLIIMLKVIKGKLGNIKKFLLVDRINNKQLKKEIQYKQRQEYLQNNFYKYRRVQYVLHRCFSKNKKVLLYCESSTMKPHIFNYYKCIKSLPNARVYIYYPKRWDNEVPTGVTLIKNDKVALFTPWDLIVCADAKVPLYFSKEETKTLYINHGLHMISYDDGESLYAYSAGKGKFSCMLEPNRSYAKLLSDSLNENIKHTGYKNAKDLMDMQSEKEACRKKLGISFDETVVAVFGSWGSDSLFHAVGKALIDQARPLQKSGYRFILSIHPKEYNKYDETIEPLGSFVDSLADEGFIVRNPKESSIDYMVASDIVICDYSTLCEEAMLAGKPVILSEFPISRVWKHSVIAEYKKCCYKFDGTNSLKELLDKVLTDDELREYAGSLVENLLPPSEGYENTVFTVTKNLLFGD